MFGLFSSKKRHFTEGGFDSPFLSHIKTDIHSHLIPGIDDGSPDLSTSLLLIKEMYRLGFRKIITTPHVNEVYANNSDTILDGLTRVKRMLENENIDMEFSVAAEYMINDLFEQKLLNDEPLLTLPNKHILVEISHISEPTNFSAVISILLEKGFTPVLAHPERYRFYNSNIVAFQRLKDMGCLFQINALSLVGYYGNGIADCTWLLLNNHMVDFIGTDIHTPRQAAALREGITPEIQRLLHFYPFKNHRFGSGEVPEIPPTHTHVMEPVLAPPQYKMRKRDILKRAIKDMLSD